MVLRSAVLGLIFCLLLAAPAAPATAQPVPADSVQPAVIGEHPTTAFHPDVTVMWLNVVKNGRTQRLPFPGLDPGPSPAIAVDGYVNGIFLLSTAPLALFVDSQPMIPIRENADGYFKIKDFGYLNHAGLWSAFLPENQGQGTSATVSSCYASFSTIPGDALSDEQALRITVVHNGNENHLSILQDPPVRIDAGHPPSSEEPLDFYFMGNDTRPFDDAPAAFEARTAAIRAGIRAVEAMIGSQIVDRVNIVDLDDQYNSYTRKGKSDIWFYSRLFWNESEAELQTIARHEALHILADRLNLAANSGLRELYAKLMGFGPFSPERFAVMTSGRPPATPSTAPPAPGASRLFAFINEINFIRGAKGGHAQDDVDEFCTSFLHTLMYAERLAPLLGQPIKYRDGFLPPLSTREREQLLEDYQTVLAAMIEGIPPHSPRQLKAVFLAGLAAVRNIDPTAEALRTVPGRRPQNS